MPLLFNQETTAPNTGDYTVKQSHRKILEQLASGCWIGVQGYSHKTKPLYRGTVFVANLRVSTLQEMIKLGLLTNQYQLVCKPL